MVSRSCRERSLRNLFAKLKFANFSQPLASLIVHRLPRICKFPGKNINFLKKELRRASQIALIYCYRSAVRNTKFCGMSESRISRLIFSFSFFFFFSFCERETAPACVGGAVARSGERQIRRLDIVEGNSVKRQDQCRGYTRPRS